MPKPLLCTIHEQKSRLVVRTPCVGFLELCIKNNELIDGARCIGTIKRLGERFLLYVPKEIHGRVVVEKSSQAVGFGEEIFFIEEALDTTSYSTKNVEKVEGLSIDAPMDGMFYLSSAPGSPSFVAVGDTVKPGQIVGLIEVMKCFYPMKYEGIETVTIQKIMLTNATPIQSGMKIYLVERCHPRA